MTCSGSSDCWAMSSYDEPALLIGAGCTRGGACGASSSVDWRKISGNSVVECMQMEALIFGRLSVVKCKTLILTYRVRGRCLQGRKCLLGLVHFNKSSEAFLFLLIVAFWHSVLVPMVPTSKWEGIFSSIMRVWRNAVERAAFILLTYVGVHCS